MQDEPTTDLSGSEGTTITEVLDAYGAAGFSGSFSITDEAAVECLACRATIEPERIRMSSLRRMEGESDPADMLAIVAITCPNCQSRGTALLGYGPMATSEEAAVLTALRDHRDDSELPGNSAPGEASGDEVVN